MAKAKRKAKPVAEMTAAQLRRLADRKEKQEEATKARKVKQAVGALVRERAALMKKVAKLDAKIAKLSGKKATKAKLVAVKSRKK